jgi:hypothetical protein
MIPVLQRQDGTFVGAAWIGGWCDVWQDMSKSMAIFDASGDVLGSVSHEEPQTATADGGVIGKSGIIYNENGSATGQSSLYTQSWTGNMYQVGSIDQFFVPPTLLATSFTAFQLARPTAALPLPDRVKALSDIVEPDPVGLLAPTVVRKISYTLYQGTTPVAASRNAVISEHLIVSYGPTPTTCDPPNTPNQFYCSSSHSGQPFPDEIGTRNHGDFGRTQQFFARLPGLRDIRVQIQRCIAQGTFADAAWQNLLNASNQTVSVRSTTADTPDTGSTQGRTCPRN